MRVITALFTCLAVLFLAVDSQSQVNNSPAPKTWPRITIDNADRLKVVQQLDRDLFHIVRGPGRQELSLLTWEQPVEVVSEVDFRPLRTIADGYSPVTFAISPDGESIAWAENNSTVIVWNVHKDEKSLIEAENAQPSVAFSPDGQWIVTGGYGTQAKVFNRQGLLVYLLESDIEGGLTPVFSPDGKMLAIGNRNGETRLFNMATGEQLRAFPRRQTQGLAFHPQGKILAIAYVDGDVGLWDVETGKLIVSERSGAKEAYSVDWSPQGDLLVSSGNQGKIVVWNPKDLTKVVELDSPEWVIQARFSSDGTRLFTAGGSFQKKDRKLSIWMVE